MSTSCNKVRAFLLILNEYVPIIDHTPDISTIICNTLNQLRDALISHETALNELDILKNNEINTNKQLPLSESSDRGIQINAMIVKFVREYCDNGHPNGLLNHGIVEAAQLSDLIVKAADKQNMVILAYKIANTWLWTYFYSKLDARSKWICSREGQEIGNQ